MATPLTTETLARVRQEFSHSGQSPATTLQTLCGLDARDATQALAEALHYRYVDTESILAAEFDASRISLSRALQRGCLPVQLGDSSCVLIGNPFDSDLLQWVEAKTASETQICLATEGDIRAVLSRIEANARAVETTQNESAQQNAVEAGGEELSLVGISEDASPIVRLVNSTLYDALKSGASDVHFESTPHGMEVKYRIDGVLDSATSVKGRDVADQAISRIKVLAELDIAERRVPQDGRFRVTLSGRTTDLRVSIMPSIHGEDAVLRILDKRQLVPSGGRLTLDLLGFSAPVLRAVRRLAAHPYGMLLVTGPTGSGKTTTLYAAISETNTGKDKIVTIEDPVEYELSGVLQIPVNEKKGLTFARGLRSILRHDPDKILVGEIRDAETAEIAVQSALTGHLVLSTVHANSVFDVFNRFSHMGVDPHALASALNGIWAQRLLRTVCPHCSQTVQADAQTVEALELDTKRLHDATLREGRGCGDCRGSGFKGRRAIAEILVMNDRIRELITSKASIVAIKDAAREGGTRLLREAALDMAIRGETTLEEVQRVTMLGT
jgi:general secretion pathway protein E